jgi:hypothetical protein
MKGFSPEEQALFETMLTSPRKALHICLKMNPVFKTSNELWGYLRGQFIKNSYTLEPKALKEIDKYKRATRRARNPIRRRGYKDKGSYSPPRANAAIKDTLELKKKEWKENRYWDYLFYLLDKVP